MFLSALFVASLAMTPNELLLLRKSHFSKDFRSRITDQDDQNIAFSAFMLHQMLTMLYVGSAGSTKDIFGNILDLKHIESSPDVYNEILTSLEYVPNITVIVRNKIFVDKHSRIHEEYKNIIVNAFKAEIESVNFVPSDEAAININEWASEKTEQMIQSIISSDSLNDTTRLVLVGATFFKGEWETEFEKSAIVTKPFYIDANNTMDVQMMYITKELYYRHDDYLEATVVTVPFKNHETNLILIVPDGKEDFLAVVARFAKMGNENVTDGCLKAKIHLGLPRFKIDHNTHLEVPLEKMGLGEIFDQTEVDFSRILEGDDRIYVSTVLQKVSVEINGEGGQRGAAIDHTVEEANGFSAVNIKSIIVDRPFIFMIKCKEALLFEGKFLKPSDTI